MGSTVSCLVALLMFMGDRAGMPNYRQGWVISNGDLLVYTWYTTSYNKDYDFAEYIAIAKKKEHIGKAAGPGAENLLKAFKSTGTCDSDYTIFKAQGKVLK